MNDVRTGKLVNLTPLRNRNIIDEIPTVCNCELYVPHRIKK